ncbi:unnamed protein product, partial [Tuber aestivum]
IANIYSPRDTLEPHRHVSKVGSAPLVAISLGCEAPFMAGVGEEEGVRVRCGDVVVMRARRGGCGVLRLRLLLGRAL